MFITRNFFSLRLISILQSRSNYLIEISVSSSSAEFVSTKRAQHNVISGFTLTWLTVAISQSMYSILLLRKVWIWNRMGLFYRSSSSFFIHPHLSSSIHLLSILFLWGAKACRVRVFQQPSWQAAYGPQADFPQKFSCSLTMKNQKNILISLSKPPL